MPDRGRTNHLWLSLTLVSFVTQVLAIAYRADLVPWNVNTNQNAKSVLEYDSTRPNTTYTPSPTNWRAIPFYTILLDKFADGDPTNNDYFNTTFENDPRELNFRYGGDLKGLQSRLDYLYGMGVRGIFIGGTPFLNMPWQADSTVFSVTFFSSPHLISFLRLFRY